MPQHIDYQGKTERDLLIELVVQGNSQIRRSDNIIERLDRVNGNIARHETCIATLTSQMNERTMPAWMGSKWRVAGMGGLAVSLATAVAVGLAELIKCL